MAGHVGYPGAGSGLATATDQVTVNTTFVKITNATAAGQKVTVTGDAQPNASVVVTVDGQTKTARANQNGRWTADFANVRAGSHQVPAEATNQWGNTASAMTRVRVTQPAKDNDRDGLTDDHERRIGRNPNKWDTDGDGLSDGQEVKGTMPFKTRTESKLPNDLPARAQAIAIMTAAGPLTVQH